MLQSALRRVDKHKPYREKPIKVNVIDHPPTSESSKTLRAPKQEEDLSKVTSSIVDLMPHSYCEQSKRHLTYLAENEHLHVLSSIYQTVRGNEL